MKKLLLAVAVAASASGCAVIDGQNATRTEIDTAYVAYVEHAAKRYGTTVVWVNYPTRRVPATPAPK